MNITQYETSTSLQINNNLINSDKIYFPLIPEGKSMMTQNSLTHLELATLISELCKGRIHWVIEWNSWVRLNEFSLWERVDQVTIKQLIVEYIKRIRKNQLIALSEGTASSSKILKDIERAGSAGFISGTESVMRSVEGISISCNLFDANPLIVGMHNGTLYDLKENSSRNIKSSDYLTKSISTGYNNSSKCPLWEKSIDEWCCGNKELANFLQVFCGYSLSGLIQFQGFLFLVGEGKNGKSVFVKVLSTLLGKYATSMQPETLMEQRKSAGAASGDIARLAGVRFVSAQEVSEGSFFNENLIKQLTGGDSIVARHLYQSEFEFTPNLKLVISGNHKPIVKGTDNGFWRRMHLIPFNASISNPDPKLTEKLLGELEGILNWCLVGWNRYQNEGLIVPAIIKAESNAYREDMDLLAQWKNENVIDRTGGTVQASLLYHSYKEWAIKNGYHPMTNNSFGRNAKRLLGEPKRNKTGMFYEGYVLASCN